MMRELTQLKKFLLYKHYSEIEVRSPAYILKVRYADTYL